MDTQKKEEQIYALMMDALDGHLSAQSESQLTQLLGEFPELAQEWEMMQTIDTLFKETPLLAPAPDFSQRALASLPNLKARLWALLTAFAFIFIAGILPIAGMIFIAGTYGNTLFEPAVLGGLSQLLGTATQAVQVVLGGIWQLFVAFGQQASQSPIAWGWFMTMLGTIFLWGGVYAYLLRRPRIVLATHK